LTAGALVNYTLSFKDKYEAYMEKLNLLTISAVTGLLFAGVAFAAPAAKSVTFTITNNSSHVIDFDTDGGVAGVCEMDKKSITDQDKKKSTLICTVDKEGKIAAGGHFAIDRNSKKPLGIFGPILSVENPPDAGLNFALQNNESAPVIGTISTNAWKADNEVVTITITDAKK
jgi:hypothetical protein